MECSQVLRVVIAALIGTGTTLVTQEAAAQSYCSWSGCVVWGPPPGGSSGGGGGGGGSNWGGDTSHPCEQTECYSPPPPPPCNVLLATKPPACPSPRPFPSGYSYGAENYASGSGIKLLLAFIDHQPYVNPGARSYAQYALEVQTWNFADPGWVFSASMRPVIDNLKAACEIQHNADKGVVFPGTISAAEALCLEAFDKISAEADGQLSFLEWFVQWASVEGINLSAITTVPVGPISWTSPGNSVRIKYDKVEADARCSQWWTNVQLQQCSVGLP